MEKWLERVEKRIRQLGLSEPDAMDRCGLNRAYLSNIRKSGHLPTLTALLKLAEGLDWKLTNILVDDTTKSDISLGPLSEIMSGEMWAAGPKKPKQYPLSILNEDLVSFEVTTDEYEPAYRRGDVVAGPRSLSGHLDNLIGRDCIVETVDGDRYFKILDRGHGAGLFTLTSFNPRNKKNNINDVRIRWAAPIKLVVRN